MSGNVGNALYAVQVGAVPHQRGLHSLFIGAVLLDPRQNPQQAVTRREACGQGEGDPAKDAKRNPEAISTQPRGGFHTP